MKDSFAYEKRSYLSTEWKTIPYEDALYVVLGTFQDNEEVRGWLAKDGIIECMYSEIRVTKKTA